MFVAGEISILLIRRVPNSYFLSAHQRCTISVEQAQIVGPKNVLLGFMIHLTRRHYGAVAYG